MKCFSGASSNRGAFEQRFLKTLKTPRSYSCTKKDWPVLSWFVFPQLLPPASWSSQPERSLPKTESKCAINRHGANTATKAWGVPHGESSPHAWLSAQVVRICLCQEEGQLLCREDRRKALTEEEALVRVESSSLRGSRLEAA